VLVPPHDGRNHTGLKVDRRHDLLFVSGGASKGIYVYDSETGADVAAFALPDAGFVNDVVLTRRAAYFTDSPVQQLYRVRIGKRGRLGEPEAVRNGRRLIVVQSNTAPGRLGGRHHQAAALR
jgi:hypothetical protein